MKKCSVINITVLMEANMKVLLVVLTLLFSIAILLIAGFQFIRLFVNEFAEMVVEAWRSPKMPSSR